jgi:hypothetical protein
MYLPYHRRIYTLILSLSPVLLQLLGTYAPTLDLAYVLLPGRGRITRGAAVEAEGTSRRQTILTRFGEVGAVKGFTRFAHVSTLA